MMLLRFLPLSILLIVALFSPQVLSIDSDFSATHYGILSGSNVVPTPTSTLNTGLVVVAANYSLGTFEYAIATNATDITGVNFYLWTSDNATGTLLLANVSRPANGYAANPGFYSGVISLSSLDASAGTTQIISVTQVYVEISTVNASVELRANLRPVSGAYTHVAVMNGNQTVPTVITRDGGIALFSVSQSNFRWTAVWTGTETISGGTGLWGPAGVGIYSTAASPLVRFNGAAGYTFSSDQNSLGGSVTRNNFDNSLLYVLTQSITYPTIGSGYIRGQVNPVTVLNDPTTPPPTTTSGVAANMSPCILLIVFVVMIMQHVLLL